MAYDNLNFGRTDSGFAESLMKVFAFKTSVDTLAVIVASGYFNDALANLRQGDLIDIKASDVSGRLVVTSADGVTPITTGTLFSG